MSLVPSAEGENLAEALGPLTSYLSEGLGIEVEGVVANNYTATVEALGAGQADVIITDAGSLYQAIERYDADLILRDVRFGATSYAAVAYTNDPDTYCDGGARNRLGQAARPPPRDRRVRRADVRRPGLGPAAAGAVRDVAFHLDGVAGGALLCVAVSIPLGFLAAAGVGPLWLRQSLRGLFAVIRAVPEVIIALVLLTVTGLTPFTGALALGIAGIGTQGKWVYETVESLTADAAEAVRAAGGGRLAVIRWALWPAAMPTLMSFALYRFEINIRTSAVLGLVGAGGIGSMLSNYTNYRQWETVGMLLIVVIVATMLIDAVSGALRRRIMEGPNARGLGRIR